MLAKLPSIQFNPAGTTDNTASSGSDVLLNLAMSNNSEKNRRKPKKIVNV